MEEVDSRVRLVRVFNFSVANAHNYFVGGDGVLVHNAIPEIELSRSKYPEAAKHILDAIAAGHSDILTIDRANARKNRKESLKGINTISGKDRDEYPPAMFKEGGTGASVRHITSSDNRGAGSTIGQACKLLPNGTKIKLKIVP